VTDKINQTQLDVSDLSVTCDWKLNGDGPLRGEFDGFGGLVVSMLASGFRVRGFKPGRSHWIFLYIKILTMPSFGGEVK
jgi:hypothetical protein